MQADIFADNVDYHDNLLRNIPGVRRAQNPFDDLTGDPADWNLALVAERGLRVPTADAVTNQPFDYGRVVSCTFDSAHWHATPFSGGSLYGVWYGWPSLNGQAE